MNEIIIDIPHAVSKYRVRCVFGGRYPGNCWWFYIEKLESVKRLFRTPIDKWVTVYDGWKEEEFKNIDELTKYAKTYFQQEVTQEQEYILSQLSIK